MNRFLLSSLCVVSAVVLLTGCRSPVKRTAQAAGRVTVAGAKAGARGTAEGVKLAGGAAVDVAKGPKDDKQLRDRK